MGTINRWTLFCEQLFRLLKAVSFFQILKFNFALGAELRISSAQDFVEFSNNVNKGSTYSGTTVFVDSDLSFSGRILEPIGKGPSSFFLGVFDGQGHVFSDIKMPSSADFVGLFVYSNGLAIKNVIIDGSCSITSSFIGSSSVHSGVIIGYCYSHSSPCTIESTVNIGSISFNGTINSTHAMALGGIAGKYITSNHESSLKN